ncbi:hypothetical protein ACTXT7_012899 [Hymenolepis weldensis]
MANLKRSTEPIKSNAVSVSNSLGPFNHIRAKPKLVSNHVFRPKRLTKLNDKCKGSEEISLAKSVSRPKRTTLKVIAQNADDKCWRLHYRNHLRSGEQPHLPNPNRVQRRSTWTHEIFLHLGTLKPQRSSIVIDLTVIPDATEAPEEDSMWI